jgi:hypothetical protein
MTPEARLRLGKLIRMLSSDKPGEVAAAAAAIGRTLAAEGSDFHALADTLCRPEPQAPPRQEPPRRPTHEEPDWHQLACDCSERSERLSDREQEFVEDMVVWCRYRDPTEKQQSWLLSIYRRVRRHG